MERMTRLRARILLGLFAFIMVLYAMRLFNLQIISTDGNTDNSTICKRSRKKPRHIRNSTNTIQYSVNSRWRRKCIYSGL